ncbi:derlin-1-like [Oscarella lobularis]|uniref:derlin-1-like n=1 Tax=Oscarella lobularis TaxID=121494 RepID=UPI003313CE17
MAEGDIAIWFKGIPIVTRVWFSLCVLFPLAGRIGLLNPLYMILEYGLVVYRFQIWRLLTCAVFYVISPATGFHYLMNLYFLYSYSRRLESGVFDGRSADYLFMVLIHWAILLVLGLLVGLWLLMDSLVMSVIYVWCQLNQDVIMQFWFGMQFKAMYFPWVLTIFGMVLRGGGVEELLGIFTGHAYFFLMFKYPQDFGGRAFLSTPQFLYKWLPNRRTIGGFGQAPISRRQDPSANVGGGRHDWGQGNVLGD